MNYKESMEWSGVENRGCFISFWVENVEIGGRYKIWGIFVLFYLR